MDAALQIERRIPFAHVAASGRFGVFKHEPLHDVRTTNVEKNHSIEWMKRAWERSPIIESRYTSDIDTYASYEWMADRVRKVDYTAKDVEAFCIVLAEYQEEYKFSERAGVFLSAMMNRCKDDGFVIRTNHLTKPFDQLGHINKKIFAVEGSAGNYLGYGMRGGSITVDGDAGDVLAFGMRGGSISVLGNIGELAGWAMVGGTIAVKGNARNSSGLGMKGGEIHIDGRYGMLAEDVDGGRIFHKGELVAGK
jgi:formylmethanofuran dehydrogenase subunit C